MAEEVKKFCLKPELRTLVYVSLCFLILIKFHFFWGRTLKICNCWVSRKEKELLIFIVPVTSIYYFYLYFQGLMGVHMKLIEGT